MALTPEEARKAMERRVAEQVERFREALNQELSDPQNEGREEIEVCVLDLVCLEAVTLIEEEFKTAGWSIRSEWGIADLSVRFIVSDYWKTLSGLDSLLG